MASLKPIARTRPGPLVTLALLAAALLAQYGDGLRMPFLGDDYSILDKTRDAPFLSLWSRTQLLYYWYRPWSRELHYWVVQRLFGVHELPFHVASLALWMGVMALYFALARRLAGERAAALTCVAVSALASWAGTLLWVAGVQELWLLFWALVFLHAFAAGRAWPAALTLLLALLSKETAGVLPGIAFAWALLVDGERPSRALRRVAPLLLLTAAWAAFHPWLWNRLVHPEVGAAETLARPSLLGIVTRTVLALFNLEEWPAPASGFGRAILAGAPALALQAALAWWALGTPPHEPGPGTGLARGRVAAFGAVWGVLGSLVLLMPSIGWHAYYGLLGALGVWLALAVLLERRAAIAVALVLFVAVLRPLRADTPSWDWSSKAYQQRAGFFLERLKDDLLRRRPHVPPHSRLYFSRVPQNIGLVVGNGPAFRVMYRDSTLRAGFYSDYRPRFPWQTEGRDFFFRFDTTLTWREVVPGPEDVVAAMRDNPEWEENHRELAQLLGSRGDWEGAAAELRKLGTAFPDRVGYVVNLAYCYERMGEDSTALTWYRRAAAMPGAGEGVAATVREFEKRLQSGR